MNKLNKTDLTEDNLALHHEIWDLYADLLEHFPDQVFSATAVAKKVKKNRKQVNRILHRLVQQDAVEILERDPYGCAIYQLSYSDNTF